MSQEDRELRMIELLESINLQLDLLLTELRSQWQFPRQVVQINRPNG